MNHPNLDRFSAFLDGDLSPEECLELEAHLRRCPDCSALFQEMEEIRTAARELPERVPPNDLWPGIARAIRSEGGDPDVIRLHPGQAPAGRTGRRGIFLSIPQAVAAGLVLALLSATLGAQLPRTDPGVASTLQAPSPEGDSPTWIRWVAEADPALEARAQEIAGLEASLLLDGRPLDATAGQILRRNLVVIDRAIEESSSALLRDPENEFLSQNLERALEARADFIRDAISLTFPTT